jgi:predicted metal-dependent phosphoesterase TrpH
VKEQPATTGRPLRSYRADLHIHTALSPCASDRMTPPAIVAAATKAGLDMIAISDHNTAGNIAAVQEAAKAAGEGLTVLPGMEITSAEEAHVLGLFPDLAAAEGAAAELRALLPPADSDYYTFFGGQPLLAATGCPVGTEPTALSAAAPLDLTETVDLIHSLGGLAIAAHVDRRSFSVLSQLGFFPAQAGFDGVEVSRRVAAGSPRLEEYSALGLPMIGSSDSHFLEEIGTAATELRLAEPRFAELTLAFAGAEGRSVARA